MIYDIICKKYKKWLSKHEYVSPLQFCPCVFKRLEYDDGEYTFYMIEYLCMLSTLLKYYSGYYCSDDCKPHPLVTKVCNKLRNYISKLMNKLSSYWVTKKNMIDDYDKLFLSKIVPKIFTPEIKDVTKDELIFYIRTTRHYPMEKLDLISFEKRPRKKVGIIKEIWYTLTLQPF